MTFSEAFSGNMGCTSLMPGETIKVSGKDNAEDPGRDAEGA